MAKNFLRTAALAAAISFSAGGAQAITLTATSDANTLISSILGGGITVIGGSQNYIGVTNQSGTFTGGTDPVGFSSGIVLTTGNINDIPGPNPTNSSAETEGVGLSGGPNDPSVNLGTAGDGDLSAIVGGSATNDAAVLEFNFQFGDGSTGGDLFFNFVFASEEYIDFVGSQYNDAFGLFIDGVNIALLEAPCSGPVTVNNVNGSTNAACYRNNVNNTNGFGNLNLDTAFDGLTAVVTASAIGLSSGNHSMKFAIADTSDNFLDSAVFIQAGTFSTEPTPKVPEPGTLAVFGIGLLGLAAARRRRKA